MEQVVYPSKADISDSDLSSHNLPSDRSDMPELHLSCQRHLTFFRVRVESWLCRVIGLQARVKWNLTFFFFYYEMAPNGIKYGPQCCFINFDSRLFRSKFFVKALSLFLLYFTLSHFHKSSPTLLQKIYFLVFHMPKNDQRWTWTWI